LPTKKCDSTSLVYGSQARPVWSILLDNRSRQDVLKSACQELSSRNLPEADRTKDDIFPAQFWAMSEKVSPQRLKDLLRDAHKDSSMALVISIRMG
jgi:hypothetical protein